MKSLPGLAISNWLLAIKKRITPSRGFTLIELLVVIAIIGVLAGFAVVSYTGAQARARDGERKSDVAQIKRALEFAKADSLDSSYYPNDLNSLTCDGAWSQGGVDYMKRFPCDPQTGTKYTYDVSGATCSGTWPATGGCDDYDLIATLENTADASAAQSQTQCGTGTGSQYVVCPD